MIRISLGNVGSGKSACAVRDMITDRTGRRIYSNILTRKIERNSILNINMILKKNLVGMTGRKKDVPKYSYTLNADFWKSINEPISIYLDEAHTIFNSRRSMSSKSIVIAEWLSLIRRVIGGAESGHGEILFITQLPNRIDVIARDMANQVRFHRCHFLKSCKDCGLTWKETNDDPEPVWKCYRCESYDIIKYDHRIEVFHFSDMKMYEAWNFFGMKSYHRHYFINDIEDVFPLYDTLQWDNLFSENDIEPIKASSDTCHNKDNKESSETSSSS